MTEPLVSVHMITYNHAPFIAQAIKGVLAQKTDFPFELVIGEDCSTDGTRDIVLEFQRRHPDIIRVITSDQNIGMKKNARRTADACRGKYVAYCEGDDYWHHPLKLQKQAEYLENHPEAGLVYSSYDVYHCQTGDVIRDFIKHKKLKMPQHPSLAELCEDKGGFSSGILTCTVMARRALVEQIVESDPFLHGDHFLMGDTQIWSEMATISQLHFIPDSLATHNLTPESATRSQDALKVLRMTLSCAERTLYFCDKYNLPKIIRESSEEMRDDTLLRIAFFTHDGKLADEVRSRKKTFTWKERIRYFGAKYKVVTVFNNVAIFFTHLFRKSHSRWR